MITMTEIVTNVKNFIKKHWIAIWLVVVILLLVFSVSYGAYTNLGSVKRVVSTKGGAGVLFSSNNLKLVANNTNDYSSKRIAISSSSETPTFEIDICNYAQNDPTRFNDSNITYTLTLTLIDSSGNDITNNIYQNLKVMKDSESGSFTNASCSMTGTLTGGKKSTDKYTITVPKEFITDNVRIKAGAVPDNSSLSATGNNKLARIFNFTENVATDSGWTGAFLETDTTGYDGFNYIIKGQGNGTITLEWDSSKLEISKVFLEENSLDVTTGENNKSTITMTVNSETKSRYDIQFYKTSDSADDYNDISTLNGYVKFNYDETTTTTG